jgi:hypothetical protein
MRADVLASGRTGGKRTGDGSLRLADAAERQGAERGESAAREAGPAQESAAVEPTGLPGQGRCDGSATIGFSTLLRSLDQHGRLLNLDND